MQLRWKPPDGKQIHCHLFQYSNIQGKGGGGEEGGEEEEEIVKQTKHLFLVSSDFFGNLRFSGWLRRRPESLVAHGASILNVEPLAQAHIVEIMTTWSHFHSHLQARAFQYRLSVINFRSICIHKRK